MTMLMINFNTVRNSYCKNRSSNTKF